MGSFLYLALLLELIFVSSLLTGNEYPEDVIGAFALISLCSIFTAYVIIKNKIYNKIVIGSSVANITILFIAISLAINKGYDYFFYNWRGMTYSQYRVMIVLGSIVIGYQLIKMILSFRNRTIK